MPITLSYTTHKKGGPAQKLREYFEIVSGGHPWVCSHESIIEFNKMLDAACEQSFREGAKFTRDYPDLEIEYKL